LPEDHWLYAPYIFAPDAEDPIELPLPILTHADQGVVVAAVRFALRAATMCGQEPDLDPDALVQNVVYALCRPKERMNEPYATGSEVVEDRRPGSGSLQPSSVDSSAQAPR